MQGNYLASRNTLPTMFREQQYHAFPWLCIVVALLLLGDSVLVVMAWRKKGIRTNYVLEKQPSSFIVDRHYLRHRLLQEEEVGAKTSVEP
jgi:hypothetical protein